MREIITKNNQTWQISFSIETENEDIVDRTIKLEVIWDKGVNWPTKKEIIEKYADKLTGWWKGQRTEVMNLLDLETFDEVDKRIEEERNK